MGFFPDLIHFLSRSRSIYDFFGWVGRKTGNLKYGKRKPHTKRNLPMRSEAISPYPHSRHNPRFPTPLNQTIKQNLPIPNLFSNFPHTNSSVSLAIIIHTPKPEMATLNSSVLACNYAISGSELSSKLAPVPSSMASVPAAGSPKLPVIKAQLTKQSNAVDSTQGRRAALACLAAALFTTAASASSANAGVIDDYLEKSKANKVLIKSLFFSFSINF